MDTDFPAAHSMDTTWFAVDRDGRVGCFRSGESGAVPRELGNAVEYSELTEPLWDLLPTCKALDDMIGQLLPGAEAQHQTLDHPRPAGTTALFFIKSLAPVEGQIRRGQAIVLESVSNSAVIIGSLSAVLVRQVHARSNCLSCFHCLPYDYFATWPTGLAERGMYYYEHLCENWIAGPYGRQRLPSAPIHIDQLPPPIRDVVKRIRYPATFADTTHMKPIEYSQCNTWFGDDSFLCSTSPSL